MIFQSPEFSPREQLRVQLCSVAQISVTSKGLEATEDLACDRPLIEYKGKVMLREQYDKENVFFKQYVSLLIISYGSVYSIPLNCI